MTGNFYSDSMSGIVKAIYIETQVKVYVNFRLQLYTWLADVNASVAKCLCF